MSFQKAVFGTTCRRMAYPWATAHTGVRAVALCRAPARAALRRQAAAVAAASTRSSNGMLTPQAWAAGAGVGRMRVSTSTRTADASARSDDEATTRDEALFASLPDRVDINRVGTWVEDSAVGVASLPLMEWGDTPRTVLLVWTSRRPRDAPFVKDTVLMLQREFGLRVLVDEVLSPVIGGEGYSVQSAAQLERVVDCVVAFGRYDAMSKISRLFNGYVPPVLSIRTKTTSGPNAANLLRSRFERLFGERFRLLNRQRVSVSIRHGGVAGEDALTRCIIHEAVIHRAPYGTPTVTKLIIDDMHFTTVVADGLIVSTPTGSTGYSRSAGGALLHPSLRCYHVVPINSTSLSFRPLLLPVEAVVKFQWDAPRGYRPLMLVLDGVEVPLQSSDTVVLRDSQFAFPSISLALD